MSGTEHAARSQLRSADALVSSALLSRQEPLIVINVVVASLAASMFARNATASVVIAWYGAMLATQAGRAVVAFRLRRVPPASRDKAGRLLLSLLSLLTGCGWGSTALLFLGSGSLASQSLVVFLLAGMAAGAVASLSAYLPALAAFLLPALAPFAVRLALLGSYETTFMAALTALYGVGLGVLGYQANRLLHRLHRLHAQNLDLVQDLRRAQAGLEARVRERTSELAAANAALAEEVEQRRRSETQVRHLLLHDALTNLPNRVLLLDRMEQALAQARRDRSGVAVALFDVDWFKRVNDTYGHLAGDQLLVELGQRVQASLRQTDTVARLGGDEFALVVPGIHQRQDVELLGKKLNQACRTPFEVEGRAIRISISIGLAWFPEHGDRSSVLLSGADLALYAAKSAGRGRACVLSAEMVDAARRERVLEDDLRQSLARQEFHLVYQPRFALPERRIVAAEALLRWNHPLRGLVPPDDFIPLAETTGMIVELGQWVLDTSCRAAAAWCSLAPGVRVAVNLSAVELRQADLVERVARSLEGASLDPSLLELEVTETACVERSTGTVEPDMRRLRRLGCRVAIDDFGNGYSSLAYLTWLPVDTIKIDRGFTRRMTSDPRAAAIVTTLVTLGAKLEKRVVAEGIESPAQLDMVEELGCDEAQGFYLGRPLGAAAFNHLLAAETAQAR